MSLSFLHPFRSNLFRTDPKFTINYNIRELSAQAIYDIAALDESRLEDPNLVTFADMKLPEHVPLVGKLLGQALNNHSNGYIQDDHVEYVFALKFEVRNH